jgi:hypothetical protein
MKVLLERFFGFSCDSSLRDTLIWIGNILITILIPSTAIWYRDSVFLKSNASFFFNTAMWAVPIFNHLRLILVEIKRKRKVMVQFQQIDRLFREHFTIGFLFDENLRVTRVKIVGIQIFVCLFIDLYALYLYRKVKLFFYYWMTMMWSMNGV